MKLSIRFVFLTIGILISANGLAQSDPIYLTINPQYADSLLNLYTDSSNFVILDLRTSGEFETGYIEGALNMDYYDDSFDANLALMDKTKVYFIYCAAGGRSGAALNKMKALEFDVVYNMQGGINAWINAGFPIVINTNIENSIIESTINIYPNPAQNHIVIDYPYNSDLISFRIIDLQGRTMVESRNMKAGKQNIDCHSWKSGLYFFQAQNTIGRFYTKRIIIN